MVRLNLEPGHDPDNATLAMLGGTNIGRPSLPLRLQSSLLLTAASTALWLARSRSRIEASAGRCTTGKPPIVATGTAAEFSTAGFSLLGVARGTPSPGYS